MADLRVLERENSLPLEPFFLQVKSILSSFSSSTYTFIVSSWTLRMLTTFRIPFTQHPTSVSKWLRELAKFFFIVTSSTTFPSSFSLQEFPLVLHLHLHRFPFLYTTALGRGLFFYYFIPSTSWPDMGLPSFSCILLAINLLFSDSKILEFRVFPFQHEFPSFIPLETHVLEGDGTSGLNL